MKLAADLRFSAAFDKLPFLSILGFLGTCPKHFPPTFTAPPVKITTTDGCLLSKVGCLSVKDVSLVSACLVCSLIECQFLYHSSSVACLVHFEQSLRIRPAALGVDRLALVLGYRRVKAWEKR